MEGKRNKWAKVTGAYLSALNLKMYDLKVKKKCEIDNHLKNWDSNLWKEEVSSKSSLILYKRSKETVKEDTVYDNTQASNILFQARTNSLPLQDRKRHANQETVCLCAPMVLRTSTTSSWTVIS